MTDAGAKIGHQSLTETSVNYWASLRYMLASTLVVGGGDGDSVW